MTYMKPFTPAGRAMVYAHMLDNTPRSRFQPAPLPWRGIIGYSVALILVTMLVAARLWGPL